MDHNESILDRVPGVHVLHRDLNVPGLLEEIHALIIGSVVITTEPVGLPDRITIVVRGFCSHEIDHRGIAVRTGHPHFREEIVIYLNGSEAHDGPAPGTGAPVFET